MGVRAGLLVLALCTPAAADSKLVSVRIAPQPDAHAPPTLFLNRCIENCVIRKTAIDDARAHTSTLPVHSGTVTEFQWGDQQWSALVHCVREVYSPYGVVVTDVQPPSLYNEAVVAGHDTELGFSGIGGISPIADDCSPSANVLSFVFANKYAPGDTLGLCWVVAHETGHAYGLDHAFGFDDGSACRDPMSYRTECGQVQKFFRDEDATCGEFAQRACQCGGELNTHRRLLELLGPGTPITAPPEVAIVTPRRGEQVQPLQGVRVSASAQRGVVELELWLNGYRWVTTSTPYAPSDLYAIRFPPEAPDGTIDVTVIAKDDLGAATTSATVTVEKGPPCETARSCAPGQDCQRGRCFWDPPVGELGDSCSYPQFCKSELCVRGTCAQACKLDDPVGCPEGYACQYTGPDGVCLPGDPPGSGCAVGGELGIGPALLLLWWRRRRRNP